MSRQDEPITPAAISWAAARTIEGHAGERRCPQCRRDGCAQLDWARREQGNVSVVPVSPAGVGP
ncbi:hypothetical protein OG792_33345 [Micromonospora sp. NBC_01699]|uniref:hypothetical protein n=1 Tax=Micromonospora sp. NBC_01699 TaxID=2975984 RepID=UPI002E28F48E|nr:hypothetical protein [Micromonospora sp. NBC_01699]